MQTVPVLIAGGGPVGMTLAKFLAGFGVRCMLVERNPTTTVHPKMDITNARSMELFRKAGVVQALRQVAVPSANNFDVTWITTLAGHELHRFRYDSVDQWRTRIRAVNDGSMPREAPMRVSQVEIEPVLATAIKAEPLVEARWNLGFESCEQDAEGVTATLRHTDTGALEQVRCLYLAGCDGGASNVRKSLGIRLEGTPAVMPRFMTHFRSSDRRLLQRFGQAWHYQSGFGTIIAQDDAEVWTLQSRFPPGMSPEDADPHAMLRTFAGTDFEYEILVANHWTPHLLVAESYGEGRVWLAGDAAHQYIPTGGYGMNTGIGDAMDMAWKLAAAAHGWAGPKLLPSIHAERHAIGLRNREGSRRHTDIRVEVGKLYLHYGEALQAPGPEGDAARAECGARIGALGNGENEAWGIEYGYWYDESSIIAHDGEGAPQDWFTYTPSTVPGVRLPNVFLDDGTALHDRLGRWFTLLAIGVRPSAALHAAAAKLGMPLDVLTPQEPWLRDIYGTGLLLVRPDQHIAWRGASCEDAEAAAAILRRALGW